MSETCCGRNDAVIPVHATLGLEVRGVHGMEVERWDERRQMWGWQAYVCEVVTKGDLSNRMEDTKPDASVI
jgi:hypothetical protein